MIMINFKSTTTHTKDFFKILLNILKVYPHIREMLKSILFIRHFTIVNSTMLLTYFTIFQKKKETT